VKIVIEPLFEASFRAGSYGFRPKRSAKQAIYDIRKWVTYGYDKVIDLDHLTEEQKPSIAKKLNAAYALEDYAAAKLAMTQLHRELMDLNPSAARSLGEGLEETLTVHRLRIPPQLRKTLACTNVIESAFSIVERVCRNVKRWEDGNQRERWVGSGLLVAEK
jgi:hypothetical protein